MVGNSEADLPQQHQGSTFRTTPPVLTTWESWGKEAIRLLCIFCFVLTAFWLPSTHASCLSREMGMDPAALSCLLRLPQQLQVVCACWVSTSLAASGCQLLKEVNGQLVVYVFFFFFFLHLFSLKKAEPATGCWQHGSAPLSHSLSSYIYLFHFPLCRGVSDLPSWSFLEEISVEFNFYVKTWL